jgi:hypothetical protein
MPKVKEEKCLTIDNSNDNICKNIPETDSEKLVKYKGFTICIQRSNNSYRSLYEDIRNNVHNDRVSDKLISSIPNMINDFPIVDIKFVDSSIYDEKYLKMNNFDSSSYEKQNFTKGSSNYTLFVKRLNKINNLKEIEKLIIKVKLYNELWCSFNDLGFSKGPLLNDDINYGFKYCDYQAYDNSLFYFDSYKRTESINFMFDTTLSKRDFYYPEILEIYKVITTQRTALAKNKTSENVDFFFDGSLYNQIEPRLVYERYMPGVICENSSEAYESFIYWTYKNYSSLGLSIGIFVCQTLVLLTLFTILFLKCCAPSKKFYNIINMIILILLCICLILDIFMWNRTRNTSKEVISFQENCQRDFVSSISSEKINPMDLAFSDSLFASLKISFGLLIILSITILMLLVSIILYFCFPDDLSLVDQRQIFELGQNQ